MAFRLRATRYIIDIMQVGNVLSGQQEEAGFLVGNGEYRWAAAASFIVERQG